MPKSDHSNPTASHVFNEEFYFFDISMLKWSKLGILLLRNIFKRCFKIGYIQVAWTPENVIDNQEDQRPHISSKLPSNNNTLNNRIFFSKKLNYLIH